MNKVERSAGLVIAPFCEGSVVFDPIAERTHVVGSVATWLLGSTEPIGLDELAAMLVDEGELPLPDAREIVTDAVAELRRLGLIGRSEHREFEPPLVPTIQTPQDGWFVGKPHGVLDRSLAFCGPDGALIDAVDTLMGDEPTHGEPDMYFGLIPTNEGGIDVIDDSLWHLEDEEHLLWQLPSIVNYTVSHADSMVVIHAGAVRTQDGAIVVVTGPINTGKSTLVAALIRAGCDYLGDESLGLDVTTTEVWAYPKPLTLDPTSQRLVGIHPVGELLTAGEHRRPTEIRTGAKAIAGKVGSVDLIVHTEYRPQEPQNRQILNSHEVVELLITNTLNLARSGTQGLATLCRVAETTPAIRITHADTVALAKEIVEVGADPTRLVDSNIT